MKKILTLFLIVALSIIMIIPAYASESVSSKETTIIEDVEEQIEGNIPEVIVKYVESINKQNWDMFREVLTPEERLDYIDFPSQYLIDNKVGLMSVKSIKIHEMKEIGNKDIALINKYYGEVDTAKYTDIKHYYIGFDYNVYEDNEFYYNGVRYELMSIGVLDGVSYIISHEYVYCDEIKTLNELGYSFNSDAEAKARNVVEQKRKGLIVDFNGNVIDTNIDNSATVSEPLDTSEPKEDSNISEFSEKRDAKEIADLDFASKGRIVPALKSTTSPPSTIKVYITSTGNVLTLSMDNYAKGVLPNEWYQDWESKALDAGALTVKTYGWYNVEHTRDPALRHGADVTDSHLNYQTYIQGSNQTSTDAAVNRYSGKFLVNSDGYVFDATHLAGTPGQIGTAYCGTVSQEGTQYIATTYPGYDVYTIVSYYYSFSPKSSRYIQIK